jgi:two-component system, OmpR family, sensor kinase
MSARRPAFRRLPIRLRLTIAFAGVFAVVVAAGGVVLYTVFERDLDGVINSDLDARADDVAAPVARGAPPRRVVLRSGERIAQVYRADGALLASTPPLVQRRVLSPAQTRSAARRDLTLDRVSTRVGDARIRAVSATAAREGSFVVAVGEALPRRDRALDRLRELLFIAGPLALLFATYAGYQVAGAALRPVERMRARAERITERDTSERLPVPGTADEIESLGLTLNELLGRLEAALARERRLLTDASHELRTPLTVLRTEAQLALRGERDASELREALESVERESERLTRLPDDLLVRARADQGRLPIRREPLAVQDLLSAAARRAAAASATDGRAIVTDSDVGAVVMADPDRTAQALDNLVGNALAHGRGEVTLSARTVAGSVELHVVDGGAGFSEELLDRVFDRFTRGDPGRSGEGTGLGLAIVVAIAQAHGGAAGARNLPAGGADVWISLPAATSA